MERQLLWGWQRCSSRARKGCCLGLVVVSIIGRAPPQESARDDAEAIPNFHATSHLVLIPGTVRSASGGFVSGLTAEDFIVLDGKREQRPIHVEQTTSQPLAVVLVMQTGGTAGRNFLQYSTVTALLGLAPIRKSAFVTFDNKPEEIWPFPIDPVPMRRAMGNPHSGDRGAAMLDAVNTAANLLQGEPPEERRLIILLSQSEDSGSKVIPRHLFERLGQMNAPIYSFSFPSQGASKDKAAERTCADDTGAALQEAASNGSILPQLRKRFCLDTATELAMISGGERFVIKSQSNLERGASLLSDAFVNGYTWSFQPNSPSPGFHSLTVRLRTATDHNSVSSRGLYWLP